MLPSLNCHQATIREVAPGTVFVASIGGTTTFCLGIDPAERETVPAFLALWPGHPMARNQVGVLNGTVISEQPILVYPEAKFAPSPNAQHLRFEVYAGVPAGALMLKGSTFGVVATNGRGRSVFSCANGEIIPGMLHSPDAVVFTSWEIRVEGPGGEPYTLCVMNAADKPFNNPFD